MANFASERDRSRAPGRMVYNLLDDLPDDLLLLCARALITPDDFRSVLLASEANKSLRERLMPACTECKLRRHSLRWGVKHTADDAVIRGDGARLRASGEAGSKWRRAYGYMLPVSGVSRWAIRIDSSRGNQGMMYFGVSHVSKVGTCEWACSPFYGRLVRKCWNMDGALLVRSSPPEGFPDFHLKSVLCDEEGQPTDLDGRAASNVIELTLDADAGTLTFRLNGGPEGTVIAGFPPGAALRPVVALRYWGGVGEEDQVTIRGGRGCFARMRQ